MHAYIHASIHNIIIYNNCYVLTYGYNATPCVGVCCRYLVICHPLKAQSINTPSRARRTVVIVWTVSLVFGAVLMPMVVRADTVSYTIAKHVT